MARRIRSVLLRLFLVAALTALLTTFAGAITNGTPADVKSNGHPYYIMVNRQCNTVTVYKLDSSGYYSVPYKAMICSTGRSGHATPTGTFKLPGYKRAWNWMVDGSVGQYATEINGNYLFHSVCYYSKSHSALMNYEYNALGSYASLGCVRLQVADAKWIYDNCATGTYVTIYDSSYPGPLGKPSRAVDYLSGDSGWEPTDPASGNPWKHVTVGISEYSTGTGTVSGGGYVYSGNSVTLHAQAASGFVFSGWFNEAGYIRSSSADYTYAVSATEKLFARFDKAITVTAAVSGDSTGSGTVSGGGTVVSGASVTLTASPAAGVNFSGWYDGAGNKISASASYSFTASQNTTLYARFDQYYTVTLTASRSGSVSGAGNYVKGSTATLTATPASGASFDGWYDMGGNLISNAASLPVEVQKNISYQALFAGDRFVDIPAGAWYLEDVLEAADRGITTGTTIVNFSPADQVNRAMAVTMLWRISGSPAPEKSASFPDVGAGTYYTDAVAWASQVGVVEGYPDGKFLPRRSISRQELATIIGRYMEKVAGVTRIESTLSFTDISAFGAYSKPYVAWLSSVGIIRGYPDGTFQPQREIIRSEGTVLLLRMAKYLEALPETPETSEEPTEAPEETPAAEEASAKETTAEEASISPAPAETPAPSPAQETPQITESPTPEPVSLPEKASEETAPAGQEAEPEETMEPSPEEPTSEAPSPAPSGT